MKTYIVNIDIEIKALDEFEAKQNLLDDIPTDYPVTIKSVEELS